MSIYSGKGSEIGFFEESIDIHVLPDGYFVSTELAVVLSGA